MSTTFANPSSVTRRRPSRVAWLLLLALGTLQLATAEHASAHALEDMAESCTLCVKLDEGSNAVTATPPPVPAAHFSAIASAPHTRILTGRCELAADSRGPPSH